MSSSMQVQDHLLQAQTLVDEFWTLGSIKTCSDGVVCICMCARLYAEASDPHTSTDTYKTSTQAPSIRLALEKVAFHIAAAN